MKGIGKLIGSSVTRFGEIYPLLQNIYYFGIILKVYLAFGKICNLLWQKFYAIGQIFIVVDGQILHNYLAI